MVTTSGKFVAKKSFPSFALMPADLQRIQSLLSATTIELVSITALKTNPRNAKMHPEQQISLLCENIRQFGFTQPMLADEDKMLLAGHARLEAAVRLKLSEVPVIFLAHLNKQQKRALALADNKLAELGVWDLECLSAELADLTDPGLDLSFDPSIMGFETVEIDQIIGGQVTSDGADPADATVSIDHQSSATIAGDLWVCEKHLLFCGDALEPQTYRVLLGGERADVGFTDPPYNVANSGHVTKRPGIREFAMASGDLTSEEFTDFLHMAASRIADNVQDGAVIFIAMDWRHQDELSAATRRVFGKPKNLIVWAKTNAGQGSFYRSQHELISVYVCGAGSPTNNFKLGARGRYRSNVWRYPGFNSFGRNRDSTLALHPTVKPVALVADALLDCSHRGEKVLDPFAGSGTTMIAAERTGRLARLIEIDPLYCDVIIRRWQTFSGKTARLAESNETFEEVCARRSKPAPNGETESHG